MAYSAGKQAIEQEKVHKYTTQELEALAKGLGETVNKATQSLQALREETESLKAVGDIAEIMRQLVTEVQNLKTEVTTLLEIKRDNLQTEAKMLSRLNESLDSAIIEYR